MTHDELVKRLHFLSRNLANEERETCERAADAIEELERERKSVIHHLDAAEFEYERERPWQGAAMLREERNKLQARVEELEGVLLSRHGGEPFSLLEELDTARDERDTLKARVEEFERDWISMLQAVAVAFQPIDSDNFAEASDGDLADEFDPWDALRQLRARVEELEKDVQEGRCIAHAAWNVECPGCLEDQADTLKQRLRDVVAVILEYGVPHKEYDNVFRRAIGAARYVRCDCGGSGTRIIDDHIAFASVDEECPCVANGTTGWRPNSER